VGAGARLESAASQDVRARSPHPCGDLEEKRLALDRTWTGDHCQVAPSDLDPPGLKNRAVGVKLAARKLEWLEYRNDLLHARNRLERLDLQLGLVADHTDDRSRNTLAQMGRQPQGGDPVEHMLDDLGRRMRFQDDDHSESLKSRVRSEERALNQFNSDDHRSSEQQTFSR